MIARAALLAGAAALLPLAASGSPARAEGEPSAHFAPAPSPQILTRTLWRSLHDGAQIMVRRRYEVRFVASGAGYRLDGRQLDVTVEAPEAVAALAEIERARIDETMFPMQLDSRGRIAAVPERGAAADPARQTAIALSQTMLRQSALPLAAKHEAQRQISAIAGAAAASAWPLDLFDPQGADFADRREIALPGGATGVVEVTVRHHPARQEVERTVTTNLAGGARISREVWTLSPE